MIIMNTELNSRERIKHNMEIAMEWAEYLDYHVSKVSVDDFFITLMVDNYSIKLSNKVLEVSKEKGITFNVSRSDRTGFLHYTSYEIGLSIVFTFFYFCS